VVSAHTGPHNEDVPEALRAALRTLGSADTKGVFSEKLKVELNLFVQPTKEKKVDETKEKGEAGTFPPACATAFPSPCLYGREQPWGLKRISIQVPN
jgi:hypothetical protein